MCNKKSELELFQEEKIKVAMQLDYPVCIISEIRACQTRNDVYRVMTKYREMGINSERRNKEKERKVTLKNQFVWRQSA